MVTEKIYKTDILELSKGISVDKKTEFFEMVIGFIRDNPNHATLGGKIHKYVNEFLSDDEREIVIEDNWDERD